MIDITYCVNRECTLREKCKRGEEMEGNYSFARFDEDGCEYFIAKARGNE